MQQFLSRTMPVSMSRKFLEENNRINNNISNGDGDGNGNGNGNDDDGGNNDDIFSSSPQSCPSSRSISPEPTFDPVLSDHSLHRQPTFSYIPIHKRRRSGSPTLIRSISFHSISTSVPNRHSSSSLLSTSTSLIQTPDSELPTTPTSLFSSHSDQSTEYTSFPNLEKFADECWTEVHVEEKKDFMGDLEMESYDEMVVGGIRFQYP